MPKGGWLSITTRVEGGQAVIEVADTGAGIQSRSPVAHLRPVLHHQADRTGHGPGPVDHLRHRPRARRRHHLRERGGQGHAVPPALPAGAGRRFAPGDGPRRGRHQPPQTGGLMTRHGSILVIDDEEIMREILETLLVREGYQVRLASNGTAGHRAGALDAVRRRHRRRDDAGHRRHRHARGAEDHRRGSAGRHGDGVRLGRDGDRRDEARRVRLHHQAVQERRGAGRAAQRARAAAAGDREPRPAAEPADALPQVRQHHRPQPAHAAGVRPDHPGGAEPIDGARQRRERHRQGAGRARAAHQLAARRSALRHASTPATCRRICSSRTCSAT